MYKKILLTLMCIPATFFARLVEVQSMSELNKELCKPVLVKFYTDWCPGCKAIAPVYKELAEQSPDVTFLSVDLDKIQEAGRKYNITKIPRIFIFKPGEDKIEVATKKQALEEAVNELKGTSSTSKKKKQITITLDTAQPNSANIQTCGKTTIVTLNSKGN